MLSEMMEKKLGDLTDEALKPFRKTSGVTLRHIRGILRVCAERNVFLFLRPTDLASTRLIEMDYATKSMDIHHKSSNWGPMKGMVPVDPAFNKLSGRDPSVSGSEAKTPQALEELMRDKNNAAHGAARIVELEISQLLFKKLTGAGMTGIERSKRLKKNEKLRNQKKGQLKAGQDFELLPVEGMKNYYESTSAQANASKVYFILEPHQANYKVFWCLRTRAGEKVPLLVFGYDVNGTPTPVTGDYDLWMVSPHMAWWKLNAQVVLVKDEHGGSAATLFSTWLLRELNKACGRERNPVFNHGAEQQNYGFAQALDEKVAMFTPGGTFAMVTKEDLPQIMAELMDAFYLVAWNKRYGDNDPHLMHSPMSEDQSKEHQAWRTEVSLRQKKDNKAWAEMANELANELKKEGETPKDDKQRQIYTFFRTLRERMDRPGEPMLTTADFGDFAYLQPVQLRAIQRELQAKIVSVTVNGGESDLDELDSWFADNLVKLEQMSAAFGPAPGPLPEKEGDFLPKGKQESVALYPGPTPDGVRWDRDQKVWICKKCSKNAKQPNPGCKPHPARQLQGKICCPRQHPVAVPVPDCPRTLCRIGCIERARAQQNPKKNVK